MFRKLDADGSRFIVLQENAVYEVERENELTAENRAAADDCDVALKRLGTKKRNCLQKHNHSSVAYSIGRRIVAH